MMPVVLFLSLVITLLCTALIGAAYYKHRLLLQDHNRVELSRNAHSALNLLAAGGMFPYRQPYDLDLYGAGKDSVQILKREWGLFDVAVVKAFRGRQVYRLCGLLGAIPDQTASTTLCLADENIPLSLAGGSIIGGACLLPESGIRYANVEGKGFTGKAPAHRETRTAGTFQPVLTDAFLERIRWLRSLPGKTGSLHIRQAATFSRQPFTEEPMVFLAPEDALLDTPMEGNILVYAHGTLTVSPSARLENVVLMARKIIVRQGFKGVAQLFARDTLIVEPGSSLMYPSVAAAVGPSRSHLSIGSGSLLEGLAVVGGESAAANSLENTLAVEEGAQVAGQVYANGMVTLRGSLHGSLACQRLYVLTASALYENLLLDGELDVRKRPLAFLTSPLLTGGTRMKILQWLE